MLINVIALLFGQCDCDTFGMFFILNEKLFV